MKEILKLVEYLTNYGQALERGVDRFVRAVPLYTKQQLKAEAKKRLNSTADHYIEHASVKLTDYILIVQLDPEDWLVNALEAGIGAFDMKQKMLQSKKAKVSKKGFRYMAIPIGKEKGGTGGSTEKGQEFQKRINDVLAQPKFGVKRLKTLMTGAVVESQQVLTDDPLVQGLYRTRQFESAEAYHGGKKKPRWQHVMFRMMSENPASRAQWEHPGIKPAQILRAVDRWLANSIEPLLESFIDSEIAALNSRMGLGQ
jgi:hypothetical protein